MASLDRLAQQLFTQGPAALQSTLMESGAQALAIGELTRAGDAVLLLQGTLVARYGLTTPELARASTELSRLLTDPEIDATERDALYNALRNASDSLAVIERRDSARYGFAANIALGQMASLMPREEMLSRVRAFMAEQAVGQSAELTPFQLAYAARDYDAAVEAYRSSLGTVDRRRMYHALAQRIVYQGGTVGDPPRIIYTAGAPGSGKSTAIGALQVAGYVDLSEFLVIDPDAIKEMIPEYAMLKELEAEARAQAASDGQRFTGPTAASVVHGESADVQRIAVQKGLSIGKNMIIDGTLTAYDYFKGVMESIRRRYPESQLSIVFVDADEATLLERVESRAKATGRDVPRSFVVKSKSLVSGSVARLREIVDAQFTIDNTGVPKIKSYYQDGEEIAVNLTVPLAAESGGGSIDYQVRLRAANLASDTSVGTVDQIKGGKRVIRVESGEYFDLAEFRDFLGRLDPSEHWVVVRGDDTMAALLMSVASGMGFETIVVGSVGSNINGVADAATFHVVTSDDDSFRSVWDGLVTRDAESRVHHIALNLDDIPELPLADVADSVIAERVASQTALRESLHASGIEFLATSQEIDAFFRGRTPVLYSGASASSWPKISPDNQQAVRDAVRRSLEVLDPEKVVIVTGGTDYGVEKVAHEIAREMGFDVLGTFVELASIDSQKIGPVTHAVEMGNSWFGKSRPVLKMVGERGGFVLFMGGGGILENEIKMAGDMGVSFYLMRGPEGAAENLASEYPSRTFVGSDGVATAILENGAGIVRSEARMMARETVSYDELLNRAQGYNVHVLGGYSGLGYENPRAVRDAIREIMIADGDGTMYVIGATVDGIGEAYRWIPEIARELGYTNVQTVGIVSHLAAEYGVASQDYLVLVESSDWSVLDEHGSSFMVRIAAETGGQMTYFKGGDIAISEIEESLSMGVRTTLVATHDIVPRSANVARRLMRNPSFDADPTRSLYDNAGLTVVK